MDLKNIGDCMRSGDGSIHINVDPLFSADHGGTRFYAKACPCFLLLSVLALGLIASEM
jgi:hypothetical protein